MKQQIFRFSGNTIKAVVLSLTVFFSSATQAAAPVELGLSNTPLFLGFTVSPNIFFVSDDSGSMDWEFMTQPHWRWYNYDSDPLRVNDWRDNGPNKRNLTGTLAAADFSPGVADGINGGYGFIFGNSDNVHGNYRANTVDCSATYYHGWTENCAGGGNHPLDVDWRGRANGLNKVYYNSNTLYEPWDGPCDPAGAACADASFTAARSNAYSSQPGYSNVRNLSMDGDANNGAFIYEVWIDDSGYATASGQPVPVPTDRPRAADNFNETGYAASGFTNGTGSDIANGVVDLWDSHMRFIVSSNSVTVRLVAYNPNPNASSPTRGLNETYLMDSSISGSACYNILGSVANVKGIRDMIVADQANAASYIGASSPVGSDCRTIAEATQNIANWYQYYRRRAYVIKNAFAEVIDAQPSFRFGLTLINKADPNNGGIFTELPAKNAVLSDHNTQLKQDYFSFVQQSAGTPLRAALKSAGDYYDEYSKDSRVDPIIYSCQKNFTVLLTDGYWNGDFSGTGDTDGDGQKNTLADVAYAYYKKDLSSLPDDVKADLPQESDLTITNGTTFQHMVTFTVAFGVEGNLRDNNADGNPDTDAAGQSWTVAGVPDKNGNWGKPVSSRQAKVDDMWHAAYNSAGIFASASSATEVSRKLINAISAVAARTGSAAAVALNSGTLNANSRLYQAKFNSEGWSGDILSVPIQDGFVDVLPVGSPDGVDDSPPECDKFQTLGELCDNEWSAAEELAKITYTNRKIYTTHSDLFKGVKFDLISSLGVSQQADLLKNPDSSNQELPPRGQDRLDYIRGDHSKEADQTNGDFRIRNEVFNLSGTTGLGIKTSLGDIIHSAPAFVGGPNFFYPKSIEADSYAKFKFDNKDRTGIVYVGANDGMLHAFNATTGVEEFAYIPGALFGKLSKLTSTSYDSQHNYYVDGSPIVFDAYDTKWKTMLASSVGGGGQVVFGLDITDPTNFSASDVAWEFTDKPRTVGTGTTLYGDADLGYTMGDVSYAKMNNGEWAVIFGNGYNNTEKDGSASKTGNGVIYVVNAFTGALIQKFDTGIGWAEDPTGGDRPNGVASVTPVDIDGDFKADYLYAGDLFGNLWKVDVSSTSDSSWGIAYTGKPFFTAVDAAGKAQPITSAVAVKRHPVNRDQTLVLFGTGKYMELSDTANTSAATDIQTFYGIWDDNSGTVAVRSNLLQQEIKSQPTVTGTDGIDREFRVTSSETEDLKYKIDWTTDKGWYMDLRLDGVAEYGEQVVVHPILRNNRIIFVTQIPNSGACGAGGSSWIMELNANDGNRLLLSPFDVNGDGIIDDNDVVSYLTTTKDTIVSGVRSKEGVVSSPGILNNKNAPTEFKYFAGTKGGVDVVTESANAEFRKRQSWRQLR